MKVGSLPIPNELVALIEAGRWPRTSDETNRQNLRPPKISTERVQRIAPDESFIFLYSPPFGTGESLIADGDQYWGAPDQSNPPGDIVFDRSVIVGDFGLGSDTAIALDYRDTTESPSVIRLRWSSDGRHNRWVLAAPSFQQFAELLEL